MAVDHGYQYSVEVKSRFALFMNDGDENQAPVSHAEPAKSEIKAPEPAQIIKGQPLRSNKNERQMESGARGRGRGSSTGIAKGVGRSSRGGASQRGGLSRSGNEVSEFTTNDDAKKEERPRGPANRGGRIGRGGAGGAGGRQREFDRHSGSDKTGVKAVPKKDGHGTGNWGTVDDDIEATMSTVNEVADEVNTSQNVEAEEVEEVGPPEPEHLTLEEYKALKKENLHVIASTQPARKPNDGKDVFKNMVVHEPVKLAKEHHDAPLKAHQQSSTMENIGISFKVFDNLASPPKGSRAPFKSSTAGQQPPQGGGERRGGSGGAGSRGAPSARGGVGGRGAPRGAAGATARPVSRGAGRGAGPSIGATNSRAGGAPPPSITSNQDFPSLS